MPLAGGVFSQSPWANDSFSQPGASVALAERIHDKKAYQLAGKVADLVLNGAPRRLTSGAMFYHAKSVAPRWAKKLDRTTTIGEHHFYAHQVLLELL